MSNKEFNQQDFNKFILDNNIIGFFEEPITFKSGRVCNCYVNWRDVVSDAFLLEKLTEFIISFIKKENLFPDSFYGIPEGATKLALLTQFKLAKISDNFSKGSHILSMGRAKPKEHGAPKDKFFIGFPKGKTIVIEDTTTTGGSLIKNLESLKEAGVEIIGVVTLTDRMEKRDDGLGVKEAVEKLGIPFYRMSNLAELLPLFWKKYPQNENIKNSIEEYFERYGIEKIKLDNPKNIADQLLEKIDEKQTPCIIGLDPVVEKIPKYLIKGNSFKDVADSFREFNFAIIDKIYDLVPAVKPQIAFYEKYGVEGLRAFKDTVDYARSKGLIVIEDGKRNDIGSTAQAYAEGHLGEVKTQLSESLSLDVDILTVNPYLGSDGINPFVDICKKYGKGIFILVKTSNPSSGEFQDKFIELNLNEKFEFERFGIDIGNKTELYNLVALRVNKYALELKGSKGYSPIGAVVGATYPHQAEILRKLMPNSFFLVPGYGAQGGTADDVIPCFNNDGYGAIVNSSRGIIFSYLKKDYPEEKFAESAREATIEMINDVNSALARNGKLPKGWSV